MEDIVILFLGALLSSNKTCEEMFKKNSEELTACIMHRDTLNKLRKQFLNEQRNISDFINDLKDKELRGFIDLLSSIIEEKLLSSLKQLSKYEQEHYIKNLAKELEVDIDIIQVAQIGD